MLAEDRPVGSVERLFHLRRGGIVGTLRPELLAVVAEAARPRVFRKGQLLLQEGERVGAAHFLIEGRVHLERAASGPIGHGGPGTSIGELGMVARQPASLSATAESDVLSLELDAETFLDLVDDHIGILRHFLREVCGRLIDGWQRQPPGTPAEVWRTSRAPAGSLRDLDLVERIFQLRNFATFDRASINALAEMGRALSEVHLPAGERLWSEGEAARHVVLVLSGEVEGRSRSGFRVLAGRGASLGALEAIAARPRWYEARVTSPLTALTGEIEVLFDVFEDNQEMALGFLTAMSRWWLTLDEQLADRHDGAATLDVTRIGPAEEPDAATSAALKEA